MIFLEERRIEILRAVTERIEAEHEHDQKKKTAQVSGDVLAHVPLGRARCAALQPGRRLIHFRPNVDH